MNLTPTETYLAAFHDVSLGIASRAFEALPVSRGTPSPAFDRLALDDLPAARRCTPAQLSDWLLGTYDTDLLTPDGREDLRQRDLLALRPLCGPNGDPLFKERHRQFSARAVR